jgi:hypothetical protein
MEVGMNRFVLIGVAALCVAIDADGARAGVVNPDISVVGQPVLTLTDDPASPDRNRPTLDPGETEFVFDAYLNPYAKGFFALSLGEEGMDLEEGTFTVFRGLPLGLNLQGGKYRVGFGKLNPAHPHLYPFGERFRVLAAYLPGQEAFNETGISLSKQIPLVGDASLTATIDYLQGDSFRIERTSTESPDDPLVTGSGDGAEQARPAAVARLSGFAMLGEQSALEVGLSASHGTNNVAAGTRTTILGADAKAKLWRSAGAYLVLQGELLRLDRQDASWSEGAGYTENRVTTAGGYLFADYHWARRYNAGVSYERFREPIRAGDAAHGFGAFAGYALMDETLLVRWVYDRFKPRTGEETSTVRLHVIYSMGPHKAHQF